MLLCYWQQGSNTVNQGWQLLRQRATPRHTSTRRRQLQKLTPTPKPCTEAQTTCSLLRQLQSCCSFITECLKNTKINASLSSHAKLRSAVVPLLCERLMHLRQLPPKKILLNGSEISEKEKSDSYKQEPKEKQFTFVSLSSHTPRHPHTELSNFNQMNLNHTQPHAAITRTGS